MSCGSSNARKWPPRPGAEYRRMSLAARSAMERGNSSNGGSWLTVTATGTVIVGRGWLCG